MTPERWQLVKQIAGEALALDPPARAAFLAKACAGDTPLHDEVLSLLSAEDPTGAFLEVDRPPDRIGAYRIVREIGRGGMGAVYLGERDADQFDQRVAIKVIKRGMDSEAVVRRFLAERQILARLQHPHIARLLDGGMTTDGRPYFVMEYLEAEPITAYARRLQLSVSARVELILAVCDAVEYAHRHLILHRDIKAENIVVDAAGAPKLLDFGIAKLLSDDGTGEARVTELGQRVMTPQSSSPEQLRGESLTTASDIYSLGLLLYELVAERRAYEIADVSADRRAQLVTDARIRKPSDVAPPAAARAIRGDLDTVILKALDADPSRRYASAADLAADLRRVGANLPVHARPATPGYRARKYVARHWRGLAVAAAVTIALAWALTNALIQGRRAERHFQEVRALANSLLFEFHDAIANLPGATPARELVIARARQYLDALSRESANDLDLKQELAEAYVRLGDAQGLYFESNLGRVADARASFDQAVALFADVSRRRPSDSRALVGSARASMKLASTHQATDPARARELLNTAIATLDRVPNATVDPTVRLAKATALIGVAENTQTPKPEALDARNRAIAIFGALSAEHPDLKDATRFLSMSLKRRAATTVMSAPQPAMLGQARDDLAQAAAIDERRVAADPADAVAKMDLALGAGYLSGVLRRSGDLAGAAEALTRAMDAREALLKLDPQNLRVRTLLIGDCGKMASIRLEQHQPADARASIDRGLGLIAFVTGAPAEQPDFRAAVAEFMKVAKTAKPAT